MVVAHEPHPTLTRSTLSVTFQPLAAFLGVRPPLQRELGAALCAAGFAVVDAGEPLIWPDSAVLAVIEPDCEHAAVRLIDQMRLAAGKPLVVALAPYWCEFEIELRRLADAVLHTPLRREEYRPVVSGLQGLLALSRWMPAALAN